MSYGDLQTVIFDIANILNERPIGYKVSDLESGSVVRPNDLIFGRSTVTVPDGLWDEGSNFNKRYAFNQRRVGAFWKNWIRNYFPSLIVRQKWHVSVRNVQPGDIVLVRDLNAIRGEWKIAQVVNTLKSKDGKVRDVLVRYKINEKGGKYSGQRDLVTVTRSVHNLLILFPIEEQ